VQLDTFHGAEEIILSDELESVQCVRIKDGSKLNLNELNGPNNDFLYAFPVSI